MYAVVFEGPAHEWFPWNCKRNKAATPKTFGSGPWCPYKPLIDGVETIMTDTETVFTSD